MSRRRKGYFQYKNFTVSQEHAAMKVGTDSDLLGTLSVGGDRILDIGTGTGVLSLMLAQRYPQARITAIEIDENAIMDARKNFQESPFSDRIVLHHQSFQDYLKESQEAGKGLFDAIVCNPPYFDRSLENPDIGRTRARHTSSLPFPVLIDGAYRLLEDEGCFSVCIPLEVLEDFMSLCLIRGFRLQHIYRIQTVPTQEAKRFVLVHRKGWVETPGDSTHCMLDEDRSRSPWYRQIMADFLVKNDQILK